MPSPPLPSPPLHHNPGARLMALLGNTPPTKPDFAASIPPASSPTELPAMLHAVPSAPLAVMAVTQAQQGGEPSSIWLCFPFEKNYFSTALSSLGRMLTDGIHTDITINTSDGSIAAHRAVLAASSPVFRSMFSQLKEEELSIVNIFDMSFQACQALLNYIYGNFNAGEFLAHRLALLTASDKYDIADLKEICLESLLEDIDANNVLERLHAAHLYRLQRLKIGCLEYMMNFVKIYEIRDEFLQGADMELVEIFQEILDAWKGCFGL